MITELFQQALNINSPWFVKSIDFNVDKKQLNIHVDFKRGTPFADPDVAEEAAKRKVRGYKKIILKSSLIY